MHRRPEADLLPLDIEISENTAESEKDHQCKIQKYGKSKRKIVGYSKRRNK